MICQQRLVDGLKLQCVPSKELGLFCSGHLDESAVMYKADVQLQIEVEPAHDLTVVGAVPVKNSDTINCCVVAAAGPVLVGALPLTLPGRPRHAGGHSARRRLVRAAERHVPGSHHPPPCLDRCRPRSLRCLQPSRWICCRLCSGHAVCTSCQHARCTPSGKCLKASTERQSYVLPPSNVQRRPAWYYNVMCVASLQLTKSNEHRCSMLGMQALTLPCYVISLCAISEFSGCRANVVTLVFWQKQTENGTYVSWVYVPSMSNFACFSFSLENQLLVVTASKRSRQLHSQVAYASRCHDGEGRRLARKMACSPPTLGIPDR